LSHGIRVAACSAVQSSTENPVPTDTFLLPGQGFCIGLPWERANLPRHGLPPAAPKPATKGNVLDQLALEGDPCAGWEIGRCEIIRRLTPGSARRLLALRHSSDGTEAEAVDMRLLDVSEADAPTIEAHAWEARRLQHPNLAHVFDCERSDEGIFWVSERVSGATIAELVEACRGRGKGLPVGLALSAVYEAALALGEVHTRSAHGLISDQAVAVGFDGVTRLLDVGLFQVLARKRSWGEVLEITGPYLSPEQVLHGRLPDPKADVYSLGVLLYECILGQPMRRGVRFEDRAKLLSTPLAPVSSVNFMLGKALDEVLFRAMSMDRAMRYANGLEFAQALKRAASSFMWRPDARAQFVGELFETRKQREQALTAHLAPRRRRTGTSQIPVQTAVAPPPQPQPAPRTEPRRAPPFPLPAKPVAAAAPKARKSKRKAQPVSPWKPMVASLVGAIAGLALGLALWPAPVAPAPSSSPAPVAALAPAVPTGETSQTDGPLVLASRDTSPRVEAPAEAPKKVARPKAKRIARADDAPLPPWLQGGSKRRR
jgi:serine/threonine-protein kinase